MLFAVTPRVDARSANVRQAAWSSGRGSALFALPIAILLCGAPGDPAVSPTLALAVASSLAPPRWPSGFRRCPSTWPCSASPTSRPRTAPRTILWLGLASSLVGAAFISLYLVVVPLVGSGKPLLSALSALASSGFALYLAAAFALLLSSGPSAPSRGWRSAPARTAAAQRRAEEETVAEQERVRIARDMHDVVAHSLAVVIAQADGARYAAASDPPSPPTRSGRSPRRRVRR